MKDLDGKRLKSLLHVLKLTQQQFGAAIGISQGQVSKIIQGKGKLDLEMVLKLYQVYDVSLLWLIGESGHPYTPEFGQYENYIHKSEHDKLKNDYKSLAQKCFSLQETI